MNAIGFREAYDPALKARLASDVVVMVASLAGFALLKIIAWSDRRLERDAQDLGFVMRRYLDAGNQDRLFTEHADLIGEEFDYEMAGARAGARHRCIAHSREQGGCCTSPNRRN
jgi:predicted nucleotidyltransferase